MKTICVDARILSIFGMGSVLRQLLYLFREQPIRWRALVNKDCKDFLWDWVEPIWVDYRINSMKEQSKKKQSDKIKQATEQVL
jgi:hypothetical protein